MRFAGGWCVALCMGLAATPAFAADKPAGDARVLAMADEQGRFRMHALSPGVYTLSAYYQVIGRGAIEIRRTNVRVVAGEITVIDLDLDAQPEP